MGTGKRFFLGLCMVCAAGSLYAQATRELLQIAQGSRSDDPQILIEALDLIEAQIEVRDAVFRDKLAAQRSDLEESFQPAFNKLEQMSPEIWETDEEFERRLDEKRQSIRQDLDEQRAAVNRQLSRDFSRSIEMFITWKRTAQENLGQVRTVPVEYLRLEPQEYLRNERIWPIRLTSLHPMMSFEDMQLQIDLGAAGHDESRDMREEIIAMDAAAQSGALRATVLWGISYRYETDAYHTEILDVTITNTMNNITYPAQQVITAEEKHIDEQAEQEVASKEIKEEEHIEKPELKDEYDPKPDEKSVIMIQADTVHIELKDGTRFQIPSDAVPGKKEIEVQEDVIPRERIPEPAPPKETPRDPLDAPAVRERVQEISLDVSLGVQVDRVSQHAQVVSIVRPAVRSAEYSLGLQFVVLRDQSSGNDDVFGFRHGLFSLIDYMHFGVDGDDFRFSAGQDTPFTLGHGMLIHQLDPLAEKPLYRRVPAHLEIHSTNFDTDLFIDDLGSPSLLGARFSVGNFQQVPIEAGIGAVVDFGITKQEYPGFDDNVYEKTAIAPFIDFRYRILEERPVVLDAVVDASLMLLLDQDVVPITESFFTLNDGPYNFSAFAGIQGSYHNLSYCVLGSVSRGMLVPQLYSRLHYTHRGDLISELFHDDNLGTTDLEFGLYLNADYHWRNITGSAFTQVSFPNVPDSLIGATVGYQRFPVDIQIGAEGEPVDIAGSASRFFLRGTVEAGCAEFSAAVIGTPSQITAFSLESTVRLTPFPDPSLVQSMLTDVTYKPGFGMRFTQGIMGDLESSTLYGITSLNPSFRTPVFEFGMKGRILYSGDPLESENLYDPRKTEGAWSFGAGLTGFSRGMDIAYDLISFIDYIRIGTPDAVVHFSAGASEPYTLGTGLLIRDLDSQVDSPLISRAPAVLDVTGSRAAAAVFIDDIWYPALLAARVSVYGKSSLSVEAGAGVIVDFGNMPTYERPFGDAVTSPFDLVVKTLITPFADVRIPLRSSETRQEHLLIGAGLLMLVDDDLQYRPDAFYSAQHGFSNYTAAAALDGTYKSLSYRAGISFSRGQLVPGLFGRSYYVVRDDVINSIMDSIGEEPSISFGVHGEASYGLGNFLFAGHADVRVPNFLESELGIEASYQYGLIALAAGFSTKPYDVFSQNARYYGSAAYLAGIAEIHGGFSGSLEAPNAYSMEIVLPIF